ncbi:MAG: tripartite tricarboxylate transporter substrate binding protein [Pseudomonadota bacterium]
MIWRTLNRTFRTALIATLGFGTAAFADYPEKPITLVIPFGAGGSHDLNARIITSTIPAHLGQAMIVKLSPGAGGQKGTQEVANAAADGYTLLFAHNYTDMLQQHVENLPYNPAEDFVPVARVNFAPIAVVVKGDSEYQTFGDLVEAAKASPGEVDMAHSGNWGALFVPAAQIMKETGAAFNLVPYQGGGPAMQALLSGDADVTMGFPSVLGPLIESGEIRVLATAGSDRLYEDVPTFSEAGMIGDIGFMHRVVLAPSGTPDDVIETLEASFTALQEDRSFQRLMSRLGENTDLMLGDDYEALRQEQSVAFKALVDSITQ